MRAFLLLFADSPMRADPAAILKAMEHCIKRPLFDLQYIVRPVPDVRNRVRALLLLPVRVPGSNFFLFRSEHVFPIDRLLESTVHQ